LARQLLPYRLFVILVADEYPRFFSRAEGHRYAHENRGANHALLMTAGETVRDFMFKVNINVTLAIRNALRRYPDLEPGIVST